AVVHDLRAARPARRNGILAALASALVAAALLLFVVTEYFDSGPHSRWNVFNPERAVATIDGRPLHVRTVSGGEEPGTVGAGPVRAGAATAGRPLHVGPLRVGEEPCPVCTGSGNLRLGLGDGVRVELSASAEARFRRPYTAEGGLQGVPIVVERGELVALVK